MSNKALPADEVTDVVQAAPSSSPDLSTEIMQKLDRQPGDRVRAVRVWGDNYRCNWIAPRNRMDFLETLFVRKSQFLRVTKSADGALMIQKLGGDN